MDAGAATQTRGLCPNVEIKALCFGRMSWTKISIEVPWYSLKILKRLWSVSNTGGGGNHVDYKNNIKHLTMTSSTLEEAADMECPNQKEWRARKPKGRPHWLGARVPRCSSLKGLGSRLEIATTISQQRKTPTWRQRPSLVGENPWNEPLKIGRCQREKCHSSYYQ